MTIDLNLFKIVHEIVIVILVQLFDLILKVGPIWFDSLLDRLSVGATSQPDCGIESVLKAVLLILLFGFGEELEFNLHRPSDRGTAWRFNLEVVFVKVVLLDAIWLVGDCNDYEVHLLETG